MLQVHQETDKKMKTPKFKSIKEEREFWDTHDSTEYHDDFEVTQDVVLVRPGECIDNMPNGIYNLGYMTGRQKK